jgi:hypothetical protein
LPQEIERWAVLSTMRRLFDSALGRDLRLCPTCRRPFVAPREVLASHEDGNHVVELSCANCGWWAIELHGGVRLSALDEALDRDSAQIEAAAEALAMSVELERIDRFAQALHADCILPEDF